MPGPAPSRKVAPEPEEKMRKKKVQLDGVEKSGYSMVSTRSDKGHSTRLVHHLNPDTATKEFHPPPPFKPDLEALKKFKTDSYFRNNVKIMSTGRSLGLLSGPGIGTFLMSTAWGFQLFALLTLTAIPFWAMAISTSGFFGKYSTELGNAEVGIPYMQPYSFNNENSPTTVLPALSFATILEDKGNFDMTSKMKYEGTSFMVGSDLGRDYFLFIIGVFDVIAVGTLMLSRYYFMKSVKTYQREYDEKVLELSDYSVLVTGIPESMNSANAEGALCTFTKCSKVMQRSPGTWLYRKFILSRQKVRLMAQQATTGQNLSKRIEKAQTKYQDVALEVVAELQNSRNHAMRGAFVVFNEPFLADSAVQEAPRGWLQRLLTPKERRLEGKYVLTVEPATAPTNYIYDHLATGWMSRMLRRAISNAIVGSVLIISLALVILLKSFQKDLVMDLILNENIVLDEITDFAPQFFPVTVASQNISTVDMDCHHILPACVDSDLNPFPRGVNLTLRYGEYLDVSPSALTSFYTNSFLGEMAQCTSKRICLDDVPEALQVACTICYCNGIAEATQDENSTLPFDFFKATTTKAQCRAFSSFDPFEAGVNAVIAILITLVNTVLGMLIRSLTKFECHRSHTEEHAALLRKTAVAQYLNTSISPLIASAEIRWLSVAVGGLIFETGYPDFTTNWYATAGSQVATILIATSIVPRIMGWVLGYIVPAISRRFSRAYTQEHLHEMSLNPELHLGDAYAEVALVAMQALTFGAGVPILYPIAAIAMLLNTIDTRCKLRYMWPVPRRFGVSCTYTYLQLIKVMVYVHVFIGAWMHSYFRMFGQIADTSFAEEAALKPREDGSSDDFMTWFNFQRLFQFNTWGHLALVISFVVFQLVPFILATVFSFLRAISGVPTRPTEAADDAVSKTFQQALSDGDISGANASYNVAHVEKAVLFDDEDLQSVHMKVSAASGLTSASGALPSGNGGDETSKLIPAGANDDEDACPSEISSINEHSEQKLADGNTEEIAHGGEQRADATEIQGEDFMSSELGLPPT